MFDIQDFIPSALNIFGWGVYIGMMRSKIIRPNPFPWLMSIMMLTISGISLVMSHASSVGLMYFSGAIPALIVFVLSLKYFTRPTHHEFLILSFALVLLIVSMLYPVVSIFGAAVYYLLTYAVFVSKVASGVSIEHPAPWGIWSLAGLAQWWVTIANYGVHDMSLLIVPLVLFLSWMSVFFVVIFKKGAVNQ